MKDYKQKIQDIKDKFDVDENKPHYISIKENKVFYTDEYKVNGKTQTDKMNEKKDDTIKLWEDNGYELYKGDFKDIPQYVNMKVERTDGKLLKGGNLLKNEPSKKFFTLVGGTRGKPIRFSLQHGNIKNIWIKPQVLEEKRIIEEFKKKQQEKEQEKKTSKKETPKPETPPLPPKPTKFSNDDLDKFLKNIYYEKENYYGRDKLFSIAKQEATKQNKKISRIEVERWLKNQTLYQLTKPSKQRKTSSPMIPTKAYNILHIEIQKYGDIIMLNSFDIFSKFMITRIIKNETTKELINAMKWILKKHLQKPKAIQTDNGSIFTSDEFKKFLEDQNITHITSTSEKNQLHAELKQYLSKLTTKITQPKINQFNKNHNNSIHSVIKMKPIDSIKEENREQVFKNTKKRSLGKTI